MTLIRSLFAAGLLLGVTTAAPTTSTSNNQFDVVSWLNRAVFNEERELVVKQALQSWLLNNPTAAKEADSELADFIKQQDNLRLSIEEQKQMNLTELLQKNIELEQLDLSARRLYLSQLNADPAIIDKRARARSSGPEGNDDTKDTKDDSEEKHSEDDDDDKPQSLKGLLKEGIEDEIEALETRQRAAQFLLDHPEEAARADKVREQVMQRLADEGEQSSMVGKNAQDIGLAQALNQSVIFRQKVIKALKHALEILENDPEQAEEASFKIAQMIENPALAEHIATSDSDDFETLQFGGPSLLPLLARTAARQGLIPMGARMPFGQYAGSSASSGAAPAGLQAAGYGQGVGNNARYSAPFTTTPFIMYM